MHQCLKAQVAGSPPSTSTALDHLGQHFHHLGPTCEEPAPLLPAPEPKAMPAPAPEVSSASLRPPSAATACSSGQAECVAEAGDSALRQWEGVQAAMLCPQSRPDLFFVALLKTI